MDSTPVSISGFANAQLHSLESLGVTYTVDALYIELEDDGTYAPRRAYFNPSTRKWRLSLVSEILERPGRSQNKRRYEDPQGARIPNELEEAVPSSWTAKLPRSDFVQFFETFDWSSTPLGPLQEWDFCLQQYVHLLIADSSSAVIYWGEEKTSIHNDFMGKLVMNRLHMQTGFMGKPFNQAWPEFVDTWNPLFDRILKQRLAEDTVNVEVFPIRGSVVEETFFTGAVLPLTDVSCQIKGFYNRAGETTKETLRERRMVTLNAIAAPSDLLVGTIWDHVFSAFKDNPRDFPLAFALSATDDVAAGRCMLHLQASIGVPSGHSCVQPQDLYSGKSGFVPYIRKAKAENRSIMLQKADNSLPDNLLTGFEWGGFGEPSSALVVIPILAGERFVSVVVIGLNPRRPFDEEYENFMNNLTRQVSATVASAVDYEESLARETRLTTQLHNSEKQIRNLAEFAPIGMCRIAVSGQIVWANDQFYEISGHRKSPEAHYELSFVDIVLEEDQATSASLWPVLVEQRQEVSVALQIKRKWTPPMTPGFETPTEEPAWILALAYPVIENNEVTSVAGYITDISTFKWAEMVQARSAKTAKDAKKLQENFVSPPVV